MGENKTQILPTDRISFDKQIAIARAFAAGYQHNDGRPVSNDEAGAIVTPALKGGTVVLTNPFFADIGLISRSDKGGFIPGQELIAYNSGCAWGEDVAREKLRPLFERTWFYRCLAARLQLAPQPIPSCIAILAEESGATKEHEARLNNLLGYLQFAGVVNVADGKVTLPNVKPFIPAAPLAPLLPLNLKPHINDLPAGTPEKFSNQEENSIFLDKDKTKRVTLNCPLFLSQAEYARICNWIKATWIIEEDENPK